jgi:hypothetical protein
MKIPSLAAFLALALSAAASAQVGAPWNKLEGQHSRISERRAIAVSDEAAWEKVWKEHDAAAPVPAVDFEKENVVAIFLGQTPNAGAKIEIVIQDDMIDSNRLNVFYKEVRSASKPFSAGMICQPFAMVKIRKAAIVSFEQNARVSIPENIKPPKNPRDGSVVRALLENLPSFDGR